MHLRIQVPGISKHFGFGGYSQVYTGGVYVSNGTVKNRKIVISPFIQGTSCQNSTIFAGKEYGLTRSHAGLSVLAARNTIYEMVGKALDNTVEVMERMFDAALVGVPSPSDVIGGIMKQLGTDDATIENSIWIGMMEQGGTNHFGLSNGLSAAARDVADPELRVMLELFAGEVVLATPDDLFGRLSLAEASLADSDSL